MVKVSVAIVAKLMNKGQQFVRISLQREKLKFGYAVQLKEGGRHDYHINPKDLCEYLGITEQELTERVKKCEAKGEGIHEPLFE